MPLIISGVTWYVNVLYGQISKFGRQSVGPGVNTGNAGGTPGSALAGPDSADPVMVSVAAHAKATTDRRIAFAPISHPPHTRLPDRPDPCGETVQMARCPAKGIAVRPFEPERIFAEIGRKTANAPYPDDRTFAPDPQEQL
ncbi:MAG: hypothetical protein AB7G47_15935 [Mycolicibacterium sp.]|uniref:hypothetical protein n=1 Tax=Mycolicibacterium sp. TaxID=2320850 RepID=UPI003D0BF912